MSYRRSSSCSDCENEELDVYDMPCARCYPIDVILDKERREGWKDFFCPIPIPLGELLDGH